MNTQTRLGRFLISRFLITIAVVAVFESLVFLFINRVAFPVVISLIMPHLENLNSLSLGNNRSADHTHTEDTVFLLPDDAGT